MARNSFYSPAEVARALGVGITTIKRWVDAGVLPAHRTVGGHRKILGADVLRLARERNFPPPDLGRLNHRAGAEAPDAGRLAGRLFDSLRTGDPAGVRSLIHGAYTAGLAVAELADAVIAPAMARFGHEWETGRADVMHEHRATLLCTAALHELKPVLEQPPRAGRPVAAGGSPEGDPSLLASLLVQLVLLDAGWEAVNLGPNTPMTAFVRAVLELKPRLVWLSATYLPDPRAFVEEYQAFSAQAFGAGAAVAVGGRGLQESIRAKIPYTFHGDGLTQLAAFARALHPCAQPPRRGRPPR